MPWLRKQSAKPVLYAVDKTFAPFFCAFWGSWCQLNVATFVCRFLKTKICEKSHPHMGWRWSVFVLGIGRNRLIERIAVQKGVGL